jgi:thiamine biosynthesis protein ThiI
MTLNQECLIFFSVENLDFNVIIASLGEVAVKGVMTRRRMQRALLSNIESALRRWGVSTYSLRIEGGRFYVENINDIRKGVISLMHVFGLEKVIPARMIAFDTLDDLAEQVGKLYGGLVAGKKFRVTASRVGKHDFTSIDVMRKVGEALRRLGGIVDLENYDVEVHVDVRDKKAYAYTNFFYGLGGIPEGTEGKVLALVSGGFDSPVAAWMMMKRGATVDYVFFNIGGEEQRKILYDVCCTLYCLYSYGRDQFLWDVEFRWIFPLMNTVPVSLRGVYLKKAMYLAAEHIALKNNYKALVTGESLVQVASQTLQNLVATEDGVKLPIFRPLIGMDKKESIAKSIEIGTYKVSVKSKEFCALATPHPSTSVKTETINKYIQETNLLDTIKTMTENYSKTIKLSQACECEKIIQEREEEIGKKIKI